MPLLTISGSGIEMLQARIATIRGSVGVALAQAMYESGDATVSALSAAAPQGVGGGSAPPIEGDAPGALKDSFVSSFEEGDGASFRIVVRTEQPNKLRYVREGRGPISPKVRQALMWEGLPHPVMSARAAVANDFVTPVLETAKMDAFDRISTAVQEAIRAG